jgi:hypothetical protein
MSLKLKKKKKRKKKRKRKREKRVGGKRVSPWIEKQIM